MIEELKNCRICPHQCKVNRLAGQKGRCQSGDKIKVALVSLHPYEEPCISGSRGSGTVFFSHCNLQCCYCQNYEISQEGKGKEITIEQLAEIFLQQQEKGAHNLNLVTPTTYADQIIEAIKLAKKAGFTLPIIYNTNGYEREETIEKLEGWIDVYLPDLKYYSDELAKRYSQIEHYFSTATKAIKKMQQQVGNPVFDEQGLIQKGMIIRHLVLPNYGLNTKHILKWIKENLPQDTYVSVMAQYFPTYQAKKQEKLNRKLTKKEYQEVENYLYTLGLQNGYMQELGEQEEEYVPDFNWKE